MTMQPTNGASRGAKLKAMAAKAGTAPAVPATRKRFLSSRESYELKAADRDKLAARLAKEDAELGAWGKDLAAGGDASFCRLCGARVPPSAPVDDKKTGGKMERRRCIPCGNGWWSPAKETSR